MNDPKLTAHVLGELPASDQSHFDKLLREDRAAEAESENTRVLVARLRAQLASEPGQERLHARQREEIFAALRQREAAYRIVPFWRRPAFVSTAVASVLVGVSVAFVWPLIDAHQRETTLAAAAHDRSARAQEDEATFQFSLNHSLPALTETELDLPAHPLVSAEARSRAAQVASTQKAAPLLLQQPAEPFSLAMAPAIPPVRGPFLGSAPKSALRPASESLLASRDAASDAAVARPPLSAGRVERQMASGARLASAPPPSPGALRFNRTQAEAARQKVLAPHAPAVESAEPAAPAPKVRQPVETPFLQVLDAPLTSIPALTGIDSYAETRKALEANRLPSKSAVRLEEWLAYFRDESRAVYGDAALPFGVASEVAACPWAPGHRLVRISLKSREPARGVQPAAKHLSGGDVALQVEFNPLQAAAYRLLGFEDRPRAKNAAPANQSAAFPEGYSVIALYEVIPAPGVESLVGEAGRLKYQSRSKRVMTSSSSELLTVKLRFQAAENSASLTREFPLTDGGLSWEKSSPDFRLSAALANFAMLLRQSPHSGEATWDLSLALAAGARPEEGAELTALIGKARDLVR